MQRIAVVGGGIAGLAAARTLERSGRCRVTLFEAAARFGGHANTVDVTLGGVSAGVDTGFLVYNERTYPRLVALFRELGIEGHPCDMSLSVQAQADGLEWSGSSLASLFAQPRNVLRPAFWRMLAELLRFNRLATRVACQGHAGEPAEAEAATLGEFLARHGFGAAFRDWYFLPMVSSIWSCPPRQMLQFPAGPLLRFCHGHGLLQLTQRPQWYAVRGGSRQYVRRIVAGLADARAAAPVLGVQRQAAGVALRTASGVEHFDQLVLACHADQTLALLGEDAGTDERAVLGAIRYQPNRAVLHTDASLLPASRSAWAAWNYEAAPDEATPTVCLHYLLNRLQPLPWPQPLLVSMNPLREPRPSAVIEEIAYAHPVFDAAATAAQARLPRLQGRRRSWFCGAWTGHGFHEDGLTSGMEVAGTLLARLDAAQDEAAA